jgi:hypothetical protein
VNFSPLPVTPLVMSWVCEMTWQTRRYTRLILWMRFLFLLLFDLVWFLFGGFFETDFSVYWSGLKWWSCLASRIAGIAGSWIEFVVYF